VGKTSLVLVDEVAVGGCFVLFICHGG
jgi:hypothetical protein